MILRVADIDVYYGQSHILHSISLKVGKTGSICVLGRNGVGKTTLLRTIMGLKDLKNGSIYFEEEDISNQEPHLIALKGLGYVPQGREIFSGFTVEENLQMGMLNFKKNYKSIPEEVLTMFPILAERLKLSAQRLSGGEQQMLAFARALVGEPRLLLLDEPTEGVAPILVKEIQKKIVECAQDRGVLLVEQKVDTAVATSETSYIMKKGVIVAEGNTKSLANEGIIDKHLAI